jgi:hypothetical protein
MGTDLLRVMISKLLNFTFILDGQQRITSIFGVFQTDIVLNEPPLWSRIFYDFGASENAQESSFIALNDMDIDSTRHFPLNCFFDPVLYRKETARYTSFRSFQGSTYSPFAMWEILSMETFRSDRSSDTNSFTCHGVAD